MKRFVFRTAIFILLGGLIYILFQLFVLPVLLVQAFGINTKDQITKSFEQAASNEYECLILGNSKLYCGINPDFLDIPTYNFAHNNDSYNQMYYKLLWVLSKNKVPSVVLLGTDYFQFSVFSDSRNSYYGPLLGEEYINDYQNKEQSIMQEVKDLLKPYKLRTLLNIPYRPNSLRENGQYVRVNSAAELVIQKRNFTILPLQLHYFKKLLDTCNSRSIMVVLTMPPLRLQERQQVTDSIQRAFNDVVLLPYSNQYVYFDFSTDSRYSESDFMDMSHLNQAAAIGFSQELNKRLKSVTIKEIL